MDEWINKRWYIHTMDYYSAFKRTKVLIDATILMNPKNILLNIGFSSVTQLCPTLCDPMNRSTPGLPVHHRLLAFYNFLQKNPNELFDQPNERCRHKRSHMV